MSQARPDLYRGGNTTSPKFDNIRPDDIPVVAGNVSPGTGGISTFNTPTTLSGKIWVLRSSVDLVDGLAAVNDRGTHYSIEPSEVMTLTAYRALLLILNTLAVRYVPPLQDEETAPEPATSVPHTSHHRSKDVRFVSNALAAVYHERVIAHWDDNDYAYIAEIVHALNCSDLSIDEASWAGKEGFTTKEQRFIAIAVSAHIKGQEKKLALKGEDEDAEADLSNDRALLRTVLKLDDDRNPVLEYL